MDCFVVVEQTAEVPHNIVAGPVAGPPSRFPEREGYRRHLFWTYTHWPNVYLFNILDIIQVVLGPPSFEADLVL